MTGPGPVPARCGRRAAGPRPARPAAARERGAVTLWLLGLCLLLFALGGLSLDLWRAFAERRVLAGAVDAAALAGASALDAEAFRADGRLAVEPGEASRRAHQQLDRLLPASTIARDVRADAAGVQVRAAAEVPLTLLRMLLPDGAPLLVRAHAAATPRARP